MSVTLPSAAVRLVPAASLHVSKPTWWLESRFHFSFADYWDPERMHFGALRVMNDDLVKPRAGFGRHPHRHAEIFSYILQGNLSHADSMGSSEALPRGCVQYMSAGRGVTHSEMNDHDETCRFIQVWLTPDTTAPGYGEPKYGSTRYTKADRHNQLLHMLSGTGPSPAWHSVNGGMAPIRLHQDGNVFVSESDAGAAYELQLAARRQAYILCMEGSMRVNSDQLQARDAAKLKGADDSATLLKLSTAEGAHFMVIEMAKSDDQ
ncbi:RmlC-like cupin [Scenedesmus sp. NREL 46B-D3]|nr:RmlC-like cupin [Scenedesmus sp. NREL 46B-D3]